MKFAGVDIGSTTVKAIVVENDQIIWKDYQRHESHQAEKTLSFLGRIEQECGLKPGSDIVFFTGSGSGIIAPLVNGRIVQEVVAVAAAVEKLHPSVHFVSEIGGEDMKTIFFADSVNGRSKQVYMQSVCSGGTGTFIEKSARKLNIDSAQLTEMPYNGETLHKISAKCGIFAEADAITLVKSGVPESEIIASLFEAVVRQNLATLAKGNTPRPEVLLLGGPNMFFKGLQETWVKHLGALWQERGVDLPEGMNPNDFIQVPDDALYYACLGCVEIAQREQHEATPYTGKDKLEWWVETGQVEAKAKDGANALAGDASTLANFLDDYRPESHEYEVRDTSEALSVGLDFGSTTVKAVAINKDGQIKLSDYLPCRGNPIEDAKEIFRRLQNKGVTELRAMGVTGYGKDLLNDIIGADVPVVETVAHATAALHFFPDADAICDVGGCDVKIMLLRQGAVVDFRLNSQCSSGNGAFLQGVAERYDVPLEEYAENAFQAQRMPELMMGCGVFLQSDIVNQQRKGWSSAEIMAGLAAVLPLNVWVFAGQFQNLRALGNKFILQGGTHRNLAVVKAQVDFIESKVPGAEIVVHPHPGEAGALGAALLAEEHASMGLATRFRGFDAIENLNYVSTTNEATTCHWCTMNCQRTFIDVEMPGAMGRPDSKVVLAPDWERVIAGNSCAKGLIEDPTEMKTRKKELDGVKDAYPNIAEIVRDTAFR